MLGEVMVPTNKRLTNVRVLTTARHKANPRLTPNCAGAQQPTRTAILGNCLICAFKRLHTPFSVRT